MARINIYYPLDQFSSYKKEFINERKTFEIASTNYSHKISYGNTNIIFNGKADADYETLMLISKVRSDADKWLELHGNHIEHSQIAWYDLLSFPNEDEIICKVDIKSAYWECAKKMLVVSQDTDDYLKSMFEPKGDLFSFIANGPDGTKQMKQTRLKALGSLATTKMIERYLMGVLQPINPDEDIITQKTKPLYLEICRQVDHIMQECHSEVPGCRYYYWDCIFIAKQHSEQAIDFFRKRDYECSVGETRIKYQEIGGAGFIESITDSKLYAVKQESKHLLERYR